MLIALCCSVLFCPVLQEAVNIRRRVHGDDRNVDIAEGFSNQVR